MTRCKPESVRAGVLLSALLLSVGCSQPNAPVAAPSEVEVIEARPERVPVVQSLVGRIAAIRSAQVRARVSGIVQKRAYDEGSDVREGALLFVIDPAPYQAALREQEANLAQARAAATNAQSRAKRLRNLAESGVVSRQDLDDAAAQAMSTSAAVEQAAAAVERARLDLSYTSVRAPIAGRASKALVTEGALVGEGDATHLTTVEQIDKVYVDFTQAAAELEQLRRQHASGSLDLAKPGTQRVRVFFEDGAAYPHAGTVDFADLAVDPNTGAVALRAVLPNPERRLLPGMFVRVTLEQGALENAYLIPQAAVQRDSDGLYVFVVAAEDKPVQRHLQAQGMQGGDWIITQGLSPGDRVVVSGIQQVRPGSAVKAIPAAQATADATPSR